LAATYWTRCVLRQGQRVRQRMFDNAGRLYSLAIGEITWAARSGYMRSSDKLDPKVGEKKRDIEPRHSRPLCRPRIEGTACDRKARFYSLTLIKTYFVRELTHLTPTTLNKPLNSCMTDRHLKKSRCLARLFRYEELSRNIGFRTRICVRRRRSARGFRQTKAST
jgi:hypothetical protein